MNNQEIIDILKSSKLFSFNNELYTDHLINFIKENDKDVQTTYLLLHFSGDISHMIRDFFIDVQNQRGICYNTKELSKFANLPYDSSFNIDDISSAFAYKIQRRLGIKTF